MSNIAAGDLRHTISLQRELVVLDTSGDPIQDDQGVVQMLWTEYATCWAKIEPLSAREFIASQAVQSNVDTRITIRARADLRPADRIVHGTTIYNIEGVLPDKWSGLEYLTLPCSSNVSVSGE